MNLLQAHRTLAFGISAIAFGGLAAANARAADGTIYFTGAIVAAPYETSQARASAGRLVFERQYIDRPSASVQVQTLAGQPAQIRFLDPHARTSNLAVGETMPIGRDGGSISVRPQATDRTTLALITVSYD